MSRHQKLVRVWVVLPLTVVYESYLINVRVMHMNMYIICTYACMYVRTYIHTYACMHMCEHFNLHIHVHRAYDNH